jgi:hypothetical protein
LVKVPWCDISPIKIPAPHLHNFRVWAFKMLLDYMDIPIVQKIHEKNKIGGIVQKYYAMLQLFALAPSISIIWVRSEDSTNNATTMLIVGTNRLIKGYYVKSNIETTQIYNYILLYGFSIERWTCFLITSSQQFYIVKSSTKTSKTPTYEACCELFAILISY